MIHSLVIDGDNVLTDLYRNFREEEKRNLWIDIASVEDFVAESGVIERYIGGEYGTNELYKYRALAVFNQIELLHELAFTVALDILTEKKLLTDELEQYLQELKEFSLLRKVNLLDTESPQVRQYHFDFPKLMEHKFSVDPYDFYYTDGIDVEVYHSEEQRDLINGYMKQYGNSLIGLGRLLIRANMGRLYRSARTLGSDDAVSVEDPLRDNVRSHAHLIQ